MPRIVELTKTDLKALTMLVNDGIGSSDQVNPHEKRALDALGKIADALRVKHEIYGGTFRVDL